VNDARRVAFVRTSAQADLFRIDDVSRVPSRPSEFLNNIWHSNAHWTDGVAADYPAANTSLLVDSLTIWD
jgi:hypothetical protein